VKEKPTNPICERISKHDDFHVGIHKFAHNENDKIFMTENIFIEIKIIINSFLSSNREKAFLA
jgi:hypothetical protein